MPRFTKETLSDAQLNSLIRYVEYAKQPPQTGGWGIGFLGPVPEGMVAWFIAAAALVAVCLTIGRRLRT
jgi:ubiquinol-cytochrome c reductase cytochrome c subunit